MRSALCVGRQHVGDEQSRSEPGARIGIGRILGRWGASFRSSARSGGGRVWAAPTTNLSQRKGTKLRNLTDESSDVTKSRTSAPDNRINARYCKRGRNDTRAGLARHVRRTPYQINHYGSYNHPPRTPQLVTKPHMKLTTGITEKPPRQPVIVGRTSTPTGRLPAGHREGTHDASCRHRPKWMRSGRRSFLCETCEDRLTVLLHRYGAAIDH